MSDRHETMKKKTVKNGGKLQILVLSFDYIEYIYYVCLSILHSDSVVVCKKVLSKTHIRGMNYNDLENDIKYLNATKTDMHFGVYVNTVGFQIIKAGEHYPVERSPFGLLFQCG